MKEKAHLKPVLKLQELTHDLPFPRASHLTDAFLSTAHHLLQGLTVHKSLLPTWLLPVNLLSLHSSLCILKMSGECDTFAECIAETNVSQDQGTHKLLRKGYQYESRWDFQLPL